ncbi:MAG: hypothetical protein QM648_05485 [Solirubrobacterales bacterium]
MTESTDAIAARLRELPALPVDGHDGFLCLTQMSVETSGLDPEAAEQWILDNGGHMKHFRVADPDNVGRGIPEPDMQPCYLVPADALG